MPRHIAILNGPSLNYLGQREPEVYGRTTLADIERMCRERAEERSLNLVFFRQTNHEGFMIDWIHEAREAQAAVAINPGSWATTSIAIADALKISNLPVIEVHISNIHQRESYRQNSFVSKVAKGVIAGVGFRSYLHAVDALADLLPLSDDGQLAGPR